jgi:PadR family transcriptional regulator PadR
MKIENATAQMRKGVLEYYILSLIFKKDFYTSEILVSLKKGKMLVVEGTVYPLLSRLKNVKLLTYRWEESSSGPPRKYYSITPEGKTFLIDLESAWKELNKAVNIITKSKIRYNEQNR